MDKDDEKTLLGGMATMLAAHGYVVREPSGREVKPRTRTAAMTITARCAADKFRYEPNPDVLVYEIVRQYVHQNLSNNDIGHLMRNGFIVLEPDYDGAKDELILKIQLRLAEQEPGPQAISISVPNPPIKHPTKKVTLTNIPALDSAQQIRAVAAEVQAQYEQFVKQLSAKKDKLDSFFK